MNFTAIDFETANNHRHSICQIGICRVENGDIIYSESILVQPPDNDFSHWNIAIHGISPDLTENKPLFPEIWNEIKHYFHNQHIVAHNTDFDLDCLFKTLDYYNLEYPKITSECTYKISGLKLINLAEALDIEILKHHDALNDALMCVNAYMKLMNGIQPDLNKISIQKQKPLFSNYERLSGNILKPDLSNSDNDSIFYNKKLVFTGVLNNISREKAAQIVKRMGADIDTIISKKTNYVIVGEGAGPSKMKKIKEYNETGSNISLIYENKFLEIIKTFENKEN